MIETSPPFYIYFLMQKKQTKYKQNNGVSLYSMYVY